MNEYVPKFYLVMIFFIMVVSRVVPHPANLTPTVVLSLLLSELTPKRVAVIIFISSQVISDILIGYLHHYACWGSWSLFVYSGLIFCILWLRFNFSHAIFATVLFWVWTNLGVFLCSDLYPHTAEGFLHCYILALPFLKTSMCGTLFYYFMIRVLALDSVPSNRVFFTAL